AVRRRRFRRAAVGAMVAPALLALASRGLDISVLVGWAFALAASTFCPMLLLGIWWPGLTARGATAGMITGAIVATAGFVAALVTGSAQDETSILAAPAIASVPIAFAVMIGASLARPAPAGSADALMVALHAPE